MKKSIFILSLLAMSCSTPAQILKKGVLNKDSLAKKARDIKKGGSTKLTNEEVVNGLKEALSRGTDKSSQLAGQVDGFYRNTRLFIPWPEEARDMKERLMKLGFSKKIEEFEMSLNRAAEEA